MLVYSIIVTVIAIAFGFSSLTKSAKISGLRGIISALEGNQDSLGAKLNKANETIVNLTPAESKRVANRIAKKKDSGKKVR